MEVQLASIAPLKECDLHQMSGCKAHVAHMDSRASVYMFKSRDQAEFQAYAKGSDESVQLPAG